MAKVQFGLVTAYAWGGSSGSGFRLGRFRQGNVSSVFLYSFHRGQFWFRVRILETVPTVLFLKTAPTVLVLASVLGKTVPTVPVSGSDSVPAPS